MFRLLSSFWQTISSISVIVCLCLTYVTAGTVSTAETASLDKLLIQLNNETSQFRSLILQWRNQSDQLDTFSQAWSRQLAQQQQQLNAIGDKVKELDSRSQVSCPTGSAKKWIPAVCESQTVGDDWVLIQRRKTGDVQFYRDWNDYKNGFGTKDTDFWLGLDAIHNLTSQGYTLLRIEFAHKDIAFFAQHSNFTVEDEQSKYRLSIGQFSGSAVSPSMLAHNGAYFSTYDRDNDDCSFNCARAHLTGWWYKVEEEVNINGAWGRDDATGMYWGSWYNLTCTEMKVRRP
ncbi:unnamed protein product [Candidula unifasciata]|uniref:Fibrinogen C-terminal domain-containing protein n=1 Tax=Candidula unifasciata TaxID=100452 RepID=A0A8S3YG67_9EUPU|nr:unnamed protein product [Candidula unifasciata]